MKKYKISNPYILLSQFLNRFTSWLFEFGTRTIELLNSWALLGFSAVMIINHSAMVNQHPYRKFASFDNDLIWISMFLVGVLQAYYLFKNTNNDNQKSGILMQISAVIWMIIAMTLGFDYPPLTTDLPVYIGISVVVGLSGFELLRRCKKLENKK